VSAAGSVSRQHPWPKRRQDRVAVSPGHAATAGFGRPTHGSFFRNFTKWWTIPKASSCSGSRPSYYS